MSQSRPPSLTRLGLNDFLFAEVGTENNGSRLTILSVLARLGHDPWEAATQWVGMPREVVLDQLTGCIARMSVRADSRADLAHLVSLLPSRLPILPNKADGGELTTEPLPKWVPVALVAVLVLGTVFGAIQAPAHPPAPVTKTAVVQKPPALN